MWQSPRYITTLGATDACGGERRHKPLGEGRSGRGEETSGTPSVAEMANPALLLLAATGIVSLSTTGSSPTIDWMEAANTIFCEGKPDGFYADSSSPDNSFYRCKDSTVVEHVSCKGSSRYNANTQMCTPSSMEITCDPAADGLFVQPGTLCRGYYRCYNGTRQDFNCPGDSYFDTSSQSCTRRGGVCHELVCSGRVNGRYADKTHDCRRSYVCEGGILRSLTSCDAGTLFNGDSCEALDRVNCSTTFKSAVSVRILPTDPCTDLPDGFQSLESDSCRSYHLCLSGQTIAKLKCAPGNHFNGVECEPAKNITCSSYCAGKPDGYLTDLGKQCRGYVKCMKGKVVEELSCEEGTLFNGKSCVPALSYRCPLLLKKNICSKLKDGYHQDYMTGCKEYFYCHRGQMLLRSACGGGKVWNGSSCVVTSEFLCLGPEVWPGCKGVEDGLHPDLSQNSKCNFYHYCSDGNRVRLRCPDDFVFNGKTCVKTDSYICPKLDSDCFDKADGYYYDPNSGCRSYFYCFNGHKLTYVCPERLIFNGTKCVDENQFNCTNKSNTCKNKTNGYHADETTGCHKYVYCLQEVSITTLECPDGNVFNGKKCIPFKVQNCSKTTKSCDTVEDGLYTEPNSQCTSYFKCVDRKRTKTFTCREGKVFNGVKCVRYMCPNKSEQLQRRGDCLDRIGFFQDYESRCNKYYFCINGIKTTLSCSRGQVFNGGLCVSDKEYTCPEND